MLYYKAEMKKDENDFYMPDCESKNFTSAIINTNYAYFLFMNINDINKEDLENGKLVEMSQEEIEEQFNKKAKDNEQERIAKEKNTVTQDEINAEILLVLQRLESKMQ